MVFKILQDNLDRLPVEIRLSTTAKSLISDANRQVVGIVIEGKDGERRIKARKGVVLACGGFEANEEMKRQYWQMMPVLNAAGRGNTGDGIRMAQELGAQLWHMWHYHGSYGFSHTDPDYPVRHPHEAVSRLDSGQGTSGAGADGVDPGRLVRQALHERAAALCAGPGRASVRSVRLGDADASRAFRPT